MNNNKQASIEEEVIKLSMINTPFHKQNYQSERDAEKKLGTNTTLNPLNLKKSFNS